MSAKKLKIIISATLIAVAAGAGAFGIFRALQHESAPDNVATSEKQTITLRNADSLHTIKNGTPIEGTYKITKDESLFYTVTTNENKIIGSGTIAHNQNGDFSRNIDVTAKKLKAGSDISLTIYAQKNNGDIADEVAIAGKYQK